MTVGAEGRESHVQKLVWSHECLSRPYRRWPDTWLLVLLSHLLCDLGQVTCLLWARFLIYKMGLLAKSSAFGSDNERSFCFS